MSVYDKNSFILIQTSAFEIKELLTKNVWLKKEVYQNYNENISFSVLTAIEKRHLKTWIAITRLITLVTQKGKIKINLNR